MFLRPFFKSFLRMFLGAVATVKYLYRASSSHFIEEEKLL